LVVRATFEEVTEFEEEVWAKQSPGTIPRRMAVEARTALRFTVSSLNSAR